MNITRTATIKLSREEVAQIIKDYLSEEGFSVYEKDIDFEVVDVSTGPQWDSYTVKKFTGCTVTCRFNTERKDT